MRVANVSLRNENSPSIKISASGREKIRIYQHEAPGSIDFSEFRLVGRVNPKNPNNKIPGRMGWIDLMHIQNKASDSFDPISSKIFYAGRYIEVSPPRKKSA